jgi:hypothetical protein
MEKWKSKLALQIWIWDKTHREGYFITRLFGKNLVVKIRKHKSISNNFTILIIIVQLYIFLMLFRSIQFKLTPNSVTTPANHFLLSELQISQKTVYANYNITKARKIGPKISIIRTQVHDIVGPTTDGGAVQIIGELTVSEICRRLSYERWTANIRMRQFQKMQRLKRKRWSWGSGVFHPRFDCWDRNYRCLRVLVWECHFTRQYCQPCARFVRV